MRRFSAGFTLIELMIAMVILAILATIAYPSYIRSTRKTNRTDATTMMISAAQMLERCYSQNYAYGTSPTCASGPAASTTSNKGYYTITVQLGVADPVTSSQTDAYLIKAVPVSGSIQSNDTSCATFYLTNNGAQIAYDSGNNLNSQTCWGS